ncbi:MAG: hypothetical protein AAGA02_05465 [Bacteroidota bacterium]
MVELARYESAEELDEVLSVLQSNSVEFKVEKQNNKDFDPSFAVKELVAEYIIHVSDFERANDILDDHLKKQLFTQIPGDYYLLNFSNEELLDVLLKSDEWSKEDYNLAQVVLSKRGYNLSKDALVRMKQKRLEELRQPEPLKIGFWWWANLFLDQLLRVYGVSILVGDTLH